MIEKQPEDYAADSVLGELYSQLEAARERRAAGEAADVALRIRREALRARLADAQLSNTTPMEYAELSAEEELCTASLKGEIAGAISRARLDMAELDQRYQVELHGYQRAVALQGRIAADDPRQAALAAECARLVG